MLKKAIFNQEQKQNMLKNDVVLCVSGGLDSMALLHFMVKQFVELKKNKNSHVNKNNQSFLEDKVQNQECDLRQNPKKNFYSKFLKSFEDFEDSKFSKIHVLYVNHGISSYASQWGNFIKEKVSLLQKVYNLQNELVFQSFELNLKEKGEVLSEKNCREKRYEVITQYCLDNNIHHIYTAHHKNDVLENNFISIFKNRLYSFAMKDKTEMVITQKQDNENNKDVKNYTISCYKPFLHHTKEELRQFLEQENQQLIELAKDLNDIKIDEKLLKTLHIEDESNSVSDNIRNVIRNELFEGIKKITGYHQYMASMESFFHHLNFSFSFYTNIIKNKLLPEIGFAKTYEYNQEQKTKQNQTEDENELQSKKWIEKTLYHYILLKHFLPYLENGEELFLTVSKFKDEDVKNKRETDCIFILEFFNLFFYSKTGYYLTGKHKKHLKNNLNTFLVNNKEFVVVDDNDVFFSFEVESWANEEDETFENKKQNIQKQAYLKMNFYLKNKE